MNKTLDRQTSVDSIKTARNGLYTSKRTFLVFVYGTLKRRHRNHQILSARRAEFLGESQTEPMFALYSHSEYGIPYLVRESAETAVRVDGELYRVDGETLRALDGLEGFPTHYDCIETRVTTTADGQEYDAFVYVMPDHAEYRLLAHQLRRLKRTRW